MVRTAIAGFARLNVANVRSSRRGTTDREPVHGAQLEAQLLKALALQRFGHGCWQDSRCRLRGQRGG